MINTVYIINNKIERIKGILRVNLQKQYFINPNYLMKY